MVVVLSLIAGVIVASPDRRDAPMPQPTVQPPATGTIDNVIVVLADDLDWKTFDGVPRLRALKDEGLTFTSHTVTDSLCCPSRVSIQRSQYLHNHHVISNVASTGGGWSTFHDLGEDQDCLPTWLTDAGVTTGYYGKYLNEYPDRSTQETTTYIPPGWSDWVVPISRDKAYAGFNYKLNDNGTIETYGDEPEDYLNDVIVSDAQDFIADTEGPFFVMVSSYAPHRPFPTAPRNANTHDGESYPRTAAFNNVGVKAASWRADLPLMPTTKLDAFWEKRVESAETIADTVDALRVTLEETGHSDDTLIIVTSDNGFHSGERRLPQGKRTPYREDTVVPLVIIGPGITPGDAEPMVTSTVDLGPTIANVMGASSPEWVDGRSFASRVTGGEMPADWRNAALTESMSISRPGDPDYQPESPPQYAALRTQEWLYVEYADGDTELFDLIADSDELVNVVDTAAPATVEGLRAALWHMKSCVGESCTFVRVP